MKLNVVTITITLLSAATIFGAVAYNGSQMEAKQAIEIETQKKASMATKVISRPQVAVVEVTGQEYQSEITGYGEAKSRYQLAFSSEVSGRVTTLSLNFETGQVVKKGAHLATIESISYEQALAQAESDLAQAKLDLLEEEREGAQAKSEWKQSGIKGTPDSALVLREPQLVKAKMALKNAQTAQKKAKQDLEDTVIKAPFDALIVSRDIQPGSYVQASSAVATLYSVDEIEVEIPLSDSQWKNLNSINNNQLSDGDEKWPVRLSSTDGTSQWQGYIGRVQQHLDTTTRQRSIVVVVDKPLEQPTDLYPGTFVTATIEGTPINNLWKLPASAISQQGNIWLVDDNNLLQKYFPQKIFEISNEVYIAPVDGIKSANVVKRPLSTYKANMSVTPKQEG